MQTSHWRQYPPNTTIVYSYFESRGGKFDEVTFFGLQYIIKRYLTGQVVTKEKIDAAELIINAHMGLGEMKHFNREGWEYILNEHGGKLPVIIKAVPEGMTVPNKNVLMTVVNTDPKCFWLTNYLETLLVQVCYPMTNPTPSPDPSPSPDLALALTLALALALAQTLPRDPARAGVVPDDSGHAVARAEEGHRRRPREDGLRHRLP